MNTLYTSTLPGKDQWKTHGENDNHKGDLVPGKKIISDKKVGFRQRRSANKGISLIQETGDGFSRQK